MSFFFNATVAKTRYDEQITRNTLVSTIFIFRLVGKFLGKNRQQNVKKQEMLVSLFNKFGC